MEKTLLWEAFVTLEKPERRELSKFVRSPFFNTKPQVIGLFDYLLGCRERGDMPDSIVAFSAAFPTTKTYNNTQLRLATSDLLRLMEHFWIYAEKFADYERGKIRLASVYRKRNLASILQLRCEKCGRTARLRYGGMPSIFTTNTK